MQLPSGPAVGRRRGTGLGRVIPKGAVQLRFMLSSTSPGKGKDR